jgi:hypothetical protein
VDALVLKHLRVGAPAHKPQQLLSHACRGASVGRRCVFD